MVQSLAAMLWIVAALVLAGPALAEPKRAAVIPVNVPASGALELLPSLKSHMARLGTLMNVLFRNIDERDKATDLIAVTDEMDVHLRRAGGFVPTSIAILPDRGAERAALERFQACLTRTRGLLADLRAALGERAGEAPKAVLLRLDKTRRDCHAAFG